ATQKGIAITLTDWQAFAELIALVHVDLSLLAWVVRPRSGEPRPGDKGGGRVFSLLAGHACCRKLLWSLVPRPAISSSSTPSSSRYRGAKAAALALVSDAVIRGLTDLPHEVGQAIS